MSPFLLDGSADPEQRVCVWCLYNQSAGWLSGGLMLANQQAVLPGVAGRRVLTWLGSPTKPEHRYCNQFWSNMVNDIKIQQFSLENATCDPESFLLQFKTAGYVNLLK